MLSKLREIEGQLQAIVPDKFRFDHGAAGYTTHYKSSNIGSWDDVLCFVPSHAQSAGDWHPIPEEWSDAGDSGYVHGDFNARYTQASRMEIKAVARDMPAFIQALADHFREQEDDFSEATEALEKMLDGLES